MFLQNKSFAEVIHLAFRVDSYSAKLDLLSRHCKGNKITGQCAFQKSIKREEQKTLCTFTHRKDLSDRPLSCLKIHAGVFANGSAGHIIYKKFVGCASGATKMN